MNYELAKELKEAGFPQEPKQTRVPTDLKGMRAPGFYLGEGGTSAIHNKNLVYIPTLSELIEACEWRMEDLTQMRHQEPNKWIASAYECEECGWEGSYMESGATPEEAVARLWLALNKK